MRNWRIISTVAAIVLAAAAGLLVWKYVNNADSRAEKHKSLVPTLVAKSRIARGTLFDQAIADKLFTTKKIPRDSLPPDRIVPDTDKNLLAVFKGKVAGTDIFAGTPIVTDEFVAASQLVSTVAGSIAKGKEAITVSLDPQHAVGGFVTPGDKVNLLISLPVTVPDPSVQGQPATNYHVTAFLLPGIKVLAVGSSTVVPQTAVANNTTPTTTQGQSNNLITFEVTRRQAEQIVQGTNLGTVTLTLNPPDFSLGQFQRPAEIVDVINLFDQQLSELKNVDSRLRQDLPSSQDLK